MIDAKDVLLVLTFKVIDDFCVRFLSYEALTQRDEEEGFRAREALGTSATRFGFSIEKYPECEFLLSQSSASQA